MPKDTGWVPSAQEKTNGQYTQTKRYKDLQSVIRLVLSLQ